MKCELLEWETTPWLLAWGPGDSLDQNQEQFHFAAFLAPSHLAWEPYLRVLRHWERIRDVSIAVLLASAPHMCHPLNHFIRSGSDDGHGGDVADLKRQVQSLQALMEQQFQRQQQQQQQPIIIMPPQQQVIKQLGEP